MESLGKKRMTACVSVGLPLLSDEIFFPALIHSFLKGRVIFQSGVCAFGKFCSLCFIGMVGALVPVHVSQHHHQKENQDKNYSCNDTSNDCKISSCWRVSNICRRVRCWTVMGRHPVCIEKWPPLVPELTASLSSPQSKGGCRRTAGRAGEKAALVQMLLV